MAVTIKDLRFSIYLNNAEAKKAAVEMQTQLISLGKEMDKLSESGKKDTPAYREKKKAFDELKASMEQNKLQAGLMGMSWKELDRLAIAMKKDLKNMIPDSKEAKQLEADLKLVNARIMELRGTSGEAESSVNKMAGGFSKFIGAAKSGDIVGMIPSLGKYAAVIGLIAGALGFVKQVMDSTRATAKEFKMDIEGFTTAWNYLLKSLAAGDFSFKGMLEAFMAGREYKKTLGEITKGQQSLSVEEAKTFNRVQKLLEIQRDATKSAKERIAAGLEIIRITEEEGRTKQKVADMTYKNEMKRLTALTGLSKQEFETFMESYNKKDFKAMDASAKAYMAKKKQLQKLIDDALTPDPELHRVLPQFADMAKDYQKELNALESSTSASTKKLANFYHKYNKSTSDDIQQVTDAYVKSIQVQGEIDQSLQRVRRTNHSQEKELQQQAAEAAKKAAEEEKKRQRELVDSTLKNAEIQNLQEVAKIKKQYASGEISNEHDYNQKLLEQQDKYDASLRTKINDMLDVKKKGHIADYTLRAELQKKKAEIDNKEIDRQIEQKNKLKRMLLDADPIAQENEAYESRLRDLGIFGKKKEEMTAEQLQAFELLEAQHNENMRKLSTKEAVKALRDLDKDQEDEIQALVKRREDTKMSESDYKEELLAIELKFLKKKLEINGVSAEEIDRLTKQYNQKMLEDSQQKASEYSSFMKRYGLDELADFKTQKETELALLKKYQQKGLLSEKQAVKVRRALQIREFDEKTKDTVEFFSEVSKIAKEASQVTSGFTDAETKRVETKYQKQIDAARKAGKDTTELEEKKEQELSQIRAKNADRDFILTSASIIATTALSAMENYKHGAKIGGPILGGVEAAIAIAYGASQLASANAAREAAKAGYYDGGFTGGTNPRQVRGVLSDGQPVHGQEFVANHKAVRNPEVRKFLDVFNAAQLDGSIGMINTTQILEKVRAGGMWQSEGKYSGGYSSPSPAGSADSGMVLAMLDRYSKTIDRLNKHLDDGITSYSVISGRNGIDEQTRRYNKMKENVSR